jgi:hypothetical protein
MYQDVGYEKAAGIMVGIVVGAALIPTLSLQIFGGKWRGFGASLDGAVALDEQVKAAVSSEAAAMYEEKEAIHQVEQLADNSQLH